MSEPGSNTRAVLDYVTGVVNKTLAELFPHDTRRVYIQNSMYQGKHAHINRAIKYKYLIIVIAS